MANTKAIEEVTRKAEELYAWRAYLAGKNLQTIADESLAALGYPISRTTAHRRIQAERERVTEEIKASAEEHRASSLARLDAMLASTVRQVDRMERRIEALSAGLGDEEDATAVHVHAEKLLASALANMRAIEERRSKLLGLDAPAQAEVTVTVKDAHDLAMEELASEMDARAVTS